MAHKIVVVLIIKGTLNLMKYAVIGELIKKPSHERCLGGSIEVKIEVNEVRKERERIVGTFIEILIV